MKKLLVKYAWQKDAELLKQLFQMTGESEREGDMVVRKAMQMQDPEKRARMLESAINFYGKSKTGAFQKEICTDEVRLVRETERAFASSADSIASCACRWT